MPQMDHVSSLRRRYQAMPNLELKEAIIAECADFISASLDKKEIKDRISSSIDSEFWQQFSEILIHYYLKRYGFDFSHPPSGPDFKIKYDDTTIHVEVITPKPEGIPSYWINHVPGTAVSFPHEEILLRWTAAIKEKAEKLLGKRDGSTKGYLEKGIVGPDDVYVIAVNARLLRGFSGMWGQINGISQFPFAAEAVFCLGPMQVKIDRNSLKIVDSDYQYRAEIIKPNGIGVPADTFLDQHFSQISAIWAVDLDESILVGRPQPTAIVHNPSARNPLPIKVLPSQVEYVAEAFEDAYKLMSSVGICAADSGFETSEF
ncbi:hypothetical protein [Methylobacterium sp. R2-1]|uniref:hypothetical protein n=1 Tax=Methylobacterium sp. R2-1 TaxID=2587064 RepID=UPI0016079D6F|nr:hypothetical protein [Methylobacterium sp. R2-1]MBB2963478.1 type I restriction enzyme S subunit [Methylobacterium sp. R2-1]